MPFYRQGRCISCFFWLEMRHFLPVVIALQCTHLATASTLPLTGKDIVLMLRMGYSTEDVVRDLEAKHFVGPLDANSEAQIRNLNGSSKLLDTLKSGQLNATKEEVAQAEQKSAATSAEAEAWSTATDVAEWRCRKAPLRAEPKSQSETGSGQVADRGPRNRSTTESPRVQWSERSANR